MIERSSETLFPAASAPVVRKPDDLHGPCGRMEAIYTPARPETRAPYAVVVCHPHPLFGGTMHNKVVYHAAKVFQQAGLAVLRFNFRGAGASAGAHDHGHGEQDDLRAAMHWLARETGLPLLVAGFSFGAWVALHACCGMAQAEKSGVRALIALGLPIEAGDRSYSYEFLSGCAMPKLFVSGSADAFGPAPALNAALAQAAQPWDLVLVPEADHFFQVAAGGARLAEMQQAIRDWLRVRLPEIGSGLPDALPLGANR